MNDKLAIIIPYAQEGSNTFFTCRALHEELLGINHEIVVVDNMCEELSLQLSKKNDAPDRGHDHVDKDGRLIESHLKVISKHNKWLKYIRYDKCLSHWQCKGIAIKNTDADYLMFIDAHCIPSHGSIRGIYEFYKEFYKTNKTTIHLPLTYNLLDDKKLIYNIKSNLDEGFVGYTFCSQTKKDDFYEVPCMSTCGCLITRELYNLLFNAWDTLTSYGGGENILNYVLSIQGIKHFIYNKGTLFHHGDKRGYHWTWDGFQYNRSTAMYLIGGEDFMWKYIKSLTGDVAVLQKIGMSVLTKNNIIFEEIKRRQIISIEKYIKIWE
jgi:hypothetical protein